jgi:hypothetical protein
MVKKLLIIAVLVLFCFPPSAGDSIDVTHGNLFPQFFREPFELMVLVTWDGLVLTTTTHDAYTVQVNPHVVAEILKKFGKEWKDVAIVIHNHQIRGLSEGDRAFLHMARTLGFKGAFGLYIIGTTEVWIYKDKEA